jgi:hypothetical protein
MFKRLVCSVSIFVLLCLVNNSLADLVAHWQFDNERVDSVGLLNWKLENGAHYSTDCKEGSHALSLDGMDDCAVQSAVGVLARAFSTRTVALWFKVYADNVTQVLYDEGGADDGLSVRIYAAYLQAAVRNSGIDVIVSGSLEGKAWTHAAVTFDNGSLRLYINGIERALASAKFTTVSSRKDAAGIGARDSQDAFGKRGTGDYFGGLIDDVRIYDNVLSADEIRELAAAGSAAGQPEREKLEAEPVGLKPEKPKPAEVPPVPDRLLRRIVYDIGPELYSFKYEEPGLMEEKGIFYGVAFGATYREWVSGSSRQALSDNKIMVRGEGRFAFGQVDYEGGIQDIETGEIYPYSVDNQDDFVLEGRLMLGPEWLSGNILSTLYAGIGYRYLNDDPPSSDPYGYERESNYYYVPIGFGIDTDLQAGWSWAGGIEYDYFIWGLQRSHIFPTILENEQNSGYGYRASIKLQKKSKDVNFVIEPFFRYWDIDDSEIEYNIWRGGLEPANETTEYGIQLFWMF